MDSWSQEVEDRVADAAWECVELWGDDDRDEIPSCTRERFWLPEAVHPWLFAVAAALAGYFVGREMPVIRKDHETVGPVAADAPEAEAVDVATLCRMEVANRGAETVYPARQIEGLVRARTLLSLYGAALEKACTPETNLVADLSALPASKADIGDAILALLWSKLFEDMTDQLRSSYIELARFQPGVTSPISLPRPEELGRAPQGEPLFEALMAQADAATKWAQIVSRERLERSDRLDQLAKQGSLTP